MQHTPSHQLTTAPAAACKWSSCIGFCGFDTSQQLVNGFAMLTMCGTSTEKFPRDSTLVLHTALAGGASGLGFVTGMMPGVVHTVSLATVTLMLMPPAGMAGVPATAGHWTCT